VLYGFNLGLAASNRRGSYEVQSASPDPPAAIASPTIEHRPRPRPRHCGYWDAKSALVDPPSGGVSSGKRSEREVHRRGGEQFLPSLLSRGIDRDGAGAAADMWGCMIGRRMQRSRLCRTLAVRRPPRRHPDAVLLVRRWAPQLALNPSVKWRGGAQSLVSKRGAKGRQGG
jgi:hypothetical protein